MAHNLHIDKKTKKASFVSSNNQVPWHGLGTVLPQELLTAEECIQHAKLDYKVELHPVDVRIGKQSIEVPDKYATVRMDTKCPLGIVGNRYEVVQNEEAFLFFDSIVGQGEAIYETAGVLGNGEKIFLTAKMPSYIKVGKNDLTEVYVALKMAHDGSGSIQAMITPVRIVCQNTLNMALKQAINKVSIRHTKNARTNMENAASLLNITNKYITEFQEIANGFSKIKINDKNVDEVAAIIFPGSKNEPSTRTNNNREALINSYHTGAGQAKIVGTAWGLLNGVSHYLCHDREYRGGVEGKFTNIMETTSLLMQQKTMDYLLRLN